MLYQSMNRTTYNFVCCIIWMMCTLSVVNVWSQNQSSFGNYYTPFGGMHVVKQNPAEIADSRYKFHAILFGVNMDASNNYIGASKRMINELIGGELNMKDSNKREYLIENLNGKSKSGYLYTDVPILNMMYSFNHKHAIGLSFGVKTLATVSNISELLARFAYDSKDPNTWTTSQNDGMAINTTMWTYLGLTYGRELINNEKHYLKGGLTLKGNFGLAGMYFQSDNMYLDILDKDYLRTANGTMNAQFGTPLYDRGGTFQTPNFGFSNMGFGADLGLVYEKRDGVDYTYEMDCRRDHIRNDLNKYKYRIGMSITDFGMVNFNSSVPLKSFTFDQNAFAGIRFDALSKPYKQYDFIDTLNSKSLAGGVTLDTNAQSFSVWTPSNVNLYFDYRIWKGFYAAASTSFGFVLNNKTGSAINNTRFGLVPRFETKALGIYMPVSYSMLSSELNVGAGLRLLFLNLGVNDWLGIAGLKDQTRNFGISMSVNIPILQKNIPKDDDEDKISNKIDKCRDIPGDCDNLGCAKPDQDADGVPDIEDKCPNAKGPLQTAGCPDQDGDGVIDKEDKCPKLAGPKEDYGCPDTDQDGLSDDRDQCPKEKGSKELDGCPDRDGDKVPDVADKCPDTAGLLTNEGCPDKIADQDNDGIADEEDACPTQSGPKSNKGCPDIPVEQKVAQLAQENLEFHTGSDVIKPISYRTLNMVAQILKQNPNLKLNLSGHTDNVGKLDKNMKLSLDRAISVKKYLQTKGIAGNRITAEGYGPTLPKADNATKVGRAINRRVEIDIIYP